MQIHQLLLPHLEHGHKVVVAVLVGRALRRHALAQQRLELVIGSEELVLAQRVELAESTQPVRDPRIEPKREVRGAILVVVGARKFVDAVVRATNVLQRFRVGRRRHRRAELALGVPARQAPGGSTAPRRSEERATHGQGPLVGMLARGQRGSAEAHVILGRRQLKALQVARHDRKVARLAVAMEVEHEVVVGERPHHTDRLVHEEVEQEAAHAHGGLLELAGGAHDAEEVGLEVARVARLLRRHHPRVARAVHQQVLVHVERHLLAAHVHPRQLVDVAPQVVDHPPRLEQKRGLLLEVGAGHVRQPRLHRVVVDHRVFSDHLEGGEVIVDAARHQHPLARHVLEELLVEHVLTLEEHVLEHVDLELREARREELRHRVVVGVTLVKVVLLREEQQRRERVRIAVEHVRVGPVVLLHRHGRVGHGRAGRHNLGPHHLCAKRVS
eukprot:5848368-Prymnesium_polylepis.1